MIPYAQSNHECFWSAYSPGAFRRPLYRHDSWQHLKQKPPAGKAGALQDSGTACGFFRGNDPPNCARAVRRRVFLSGMSLYAMTASQVGIPVLARLNPCGVATRKIKANTKHYKHTRMQFQKFTLVAVLRRTLSVFLVKTELLCLTLANFNNA